MTTTIMPPQRIVFIIIFLNVFVIYASSTTFPVKKLYTNHLWIPNCFRRNDCQTNVEKTRWRHRSRRRNYLLPFVVVGGNGTGDSIEKDKSTQVPLKESNSTVKRNAIMHDNVPTKTDTNDVSTNTTTKMNDNHSYAVVSVLVYDTCGGVSEGNNHMCYQSSSLSSTTTTTTTIKTTAQDHQPKIQSGCLLIPVTDNDDDVLDENNNNTIQIFKINSSSNSADRNRPWNDHDNRTNNYMNDPALWHSVSLLSDVVVLVIYNSRTNNNKKSEMSHNPNKNYSTSAKATTSPENGSRHKQRNLELLVSALKAGFLQRSIYGTINNNKNNSNRHNVDKDAIVDRTSTDTLIHKGRLIVLVVNNDDEKNPKAYDDSSYRPTNEMDPGVVSPVSATTSVDENVDNEWMILKQFLFQDLWTLKDELFLDRYDLCTISTYESTLYDTVIDSDASDYNNVHNSHNNTNENQNQHQRRQGIRKYYNVVEMSAFPLLFQKTHEALRGGFENKLDLNSSTRSAEPPAMSLFLKRKYNSLPNTNNGTGIIQSNSSTTTTIPSSYQLRQQLKQPRRPLAFVLKQSGLFNRRVGRWFQGRKNLKRSGTTISKMNAIVINNKTTISPPKLVPKEFVSTAKEDRIEQDDNDVLFHGIGDDFMQYYNSHVRAMDPMFYTVLRTIQDSFSELDRILDGESSSNTLTFNEELDDQRSSASSAATTIAEFDFGRYTNIILQQLHEYESAHYNQIKEKNTNNANENVDTNDNNRHFRNMVKLIGQQIQSRYIRYIQQLRDLYGQQYEQFLESCNNDYDTDTSDNLKSTNDVDNDAKIMIHTITSQFRTVSQAAIPLLARRNYGNSDNESPYHDQCDLDYVSVLAGLMDDMMKATEIRQQHDLSSVFFGDDTDDQLNGSKKNSNRSTNNATLKRLFSWIQNEKRQAIVKKVASQALVLAVNYVQGWLAWKGIQRAALERERALPKFPLF